MVAQLTWLKKRAEANQLELPVKPEMLSTLRYIYTDGTLSCYASKPNDMKYIYNEIELPMRKLLNVTRNGKLLIKNDYFKFILLCINSLLKLLGNPTRTLLPHELKFIDELKTIRTLSEENKLTLPFRNYIPNYNGFIKSDSSLTDIKNAANLFKIIDNYIFNGTRPDSWLTPKHAEDDIRKYLIK
ncbi:hypothetical protein GCM10027342_36770 [Photobacterium alginatilyticum]